MYVGLHAPGWLYVLGSLPERTYHFEPPIARATDLGQAPNLRAESGPAPCVTRSREHEERPTAARETNAEGPKKNIYIHSYITWYVLVRHLAGFITEL